MYIAKLSMSIGKAIVRPKQETSMSIQSNYAHLFFADLIKNYEEILPPSIERKRRESAQRAMPVRKRTKLVDARQMRRSIDASADPRKYLEAQFALKNPNSRPSSPNPGGSGGRPPAFLTPPHSPPTLPAGGGLPTIDTSGFGMEGVGSGVAALAPSPVDLNDHISPKPAAPPIAEAPPPVSTKPPSPPADIQRASEYPMDEPFAPPISGSGPSPPLTSPLNGPASPTATSPGGDTILAAGPPSLSRKTSGEQSRLGIRGPRVSLARGPRPLSTAAAATVPLGSRPRQGSFGSPRPPATGRAGSPGADVRNPVRPRTPPDVKEYLPTKRGGRASAGSFSAARGPPQ